jgi:hypothetical protein
MKKLILITLTLSLCGCGTGAMRFYNPVTKANVECEGVLVGKPKKTRIYV